MTWSNNNRIRGFMFWLPKPRSPLPLRKFNTISMHPTVNIRRIYVMLKCKSKNEHYQISEAWHVAYFRSIENRLLSYDGNKYPKQTLSIYCVSSHCYLHTKHFMELYSITKAVHRWFFQLLFRNIFLYRQSSRNEKLKFNS